MNPRVSDIVPEIICAKRCELPKNSRRIIKRWTNTIVILIPIFQQIQTCLCLIWFIWSADAFSIFALEPVSFSKGQFIDMKAMDISSNKSLFSYGYYYTQYCSLGERNNFRFVNTQYMIQMAENTSCKLLCNLKDQPAHDRSVSMLAVAAGIYHEFLVHL